MKITLARNQLGILAFAIGSLKRVRGSPISPLYS